MKKQERTINGFTQEFETKLLKELKQTEQAYKKGKIKAQSVKDFKKL